MVEIGILQMAKTLNRWDIWWPEYTASLGESIGHEDLRAQALPDMKLLDPKLRGWLIHLKSRITKSRRVVSRPRFYTNHLQPFFVIDYTGSYDCEAGAEQAVK